MIKSFKNFINESFIQSKEYSDYLKSENFYDKSFFMENLLEVKDLENTKISFYKTTVDSKGHLINTKLEDTNYKNRYTIIVGYESNSNIDLNKFEKVLIDLNTIQISINEMVDRSLEESDLIVIKNSVSIGKDNLNHRIENFYRFEVVFESNVNLHKLRSYYNQWLDFEDEEYTNGIRELENIYKKEGIDFHKHMSKNDEGELLLIGFYTDDELFIVARYDKEKKQFDIDGGELDDSIHYYR